MEGPTLTFGVYKQDQQKLKVLFCFAQYLIAGGISPGALQFSVILNAGIDNCERIRLQFPYMVVCTWLWIYHLL